MKQDIAEHNNLSQLEAAKVEELETLLNDWRKEVKARPLRKNPKTGATPPVLW